MGFDGSRKLWWRGRIGSTLILYYIYGNVNKISCDQSN